MLLSRMSLSQPRHQRNSKKSWCSARAARPRTETVAPVDIIAGDDFKRLGTPEMDNMLRSLVPSYNVSQQPINDESTLVRPANLRGLPPDNTLVLVNGKRRHRAGVITFLGDGVSDGAQGLTSVRFRASR